MLKSRKEFVQLSLFVTRIIGHANKTHSDESAVWRLRRRYDQAGETW